MASEIVAPQGPDDMNLSVPGATQYLQSLARIAVSICVDSPHLWDCPEPAGFQRDLLEGLLRCPHYEVRLFALDQLLRRLQKTEEESQPRAQGPLPFDLSVSSLTSLALRETYPGCQAKVRKSRFCFRIYCTQLYKMLQKLKKIQHKNNLTKLAKAATLQNFKRFTKTMHYFNFKYSSKPYKTQYKNEQIHKMQCKSLQNISLKNTLQSPHHPNLTTNTTE